MTLLLGAAVSFAVLVAAVRWASRPRPRRYTPSVTLHETPTVAVGLRPNAIENERRKCARELERFARSLPLHGGR